MDFEKIKQKIANFDPNAAFASVVATVGSMGTEGYVTIGYLVLAGITTLFTLRQTQQKAKRDDEMKVQEIAMKELEVETKRIENKFKLKELEDGHVK